METKIISAFPLSGKTYLCDHTYSLKVLDSDSSAFSWIDKSDGTRVRNPEFPNNYIQHILDEYGHYDIICVSSHQQVRDALHDAGIEFISVYPDRSLKAEWIDRYLNRPNNGFSIELLKNNWDNWIDQMELETGPKIILTSGYYLMDACRSVQPGRVYRFFTGKEYCVISTGVYTVNGGQVVIYESVDADDDVVWVKPLSEFLGHVDKDLYPQAKQTYMFEETPKLYDT